MFCFLRLRCARHYAISSRQKIHPKIVYFFKILVVYELTLLPHPFQVHSFLEVFDRY